MGEAKGFISEDIVSLGGDLLIQSQQFISVFV